MQERETRLDKRPMLAFRVSIMFRSVGRYSEMGYTMGHKKGPKGYKFAPLSM